MPKIYVWFRVALPALLSLVGCVPAKNTDVPQASARGPIDIRVRQTAGGPRIFLDGKVVAPRAYYGAGPCIAFYSETKEYDFTLPFTAQETTVSNEYRITFNSNRIDYTLRNVRLERDGKTVALQGTFDTPESFAAAWRGVGAGGTVGHDGTCVTVTTDPSKGPFRLVGTSPYRLEKGVKYRLKFAIRASQGRQWFEPQCWQRTVAGGLVRCPLSYGDTFVDTSKLACEAGARFITGGIGYSWSKPGDDETWRRADKRFADIIAAAPDALVFPRIGADAPSWYLAQHPEIRTVYDNGFTNSIVSIADPTYRRDACAFVEKLTRHLREKFPRNFAGLHVSGQSAGEWVYQNSNDRPLGGYDRPSQEAFRRYLAARGIAEASSAEVPTGTVRRDRTDGLMVDPTKEPLLTEFLRFRQEDMARFVSELGAAIRRGSDGHVLSVFFYGYGWEHGTCPSGPSASGHYALEMLLRECAGNIDILSGPCCYQNRAWPGSTSAMSAIETIHRHGVLWFNEDDTRTDLEDVWDYKTGQGSALTTRPHVRDTLLRNAAFEIVRGEGDWWMDLFGRGWYRDRELWDIRRELAPLEKAMESRTRPYSAEVAYCLDETSMVLYRPGAPGAVASLVFRMMFDGCGAPYAQYLLNDVLDNPPSETKLFYLPFAWHLDAEQRAKIVRLRKARPDATFVWVWAPGWASERGLGTETMREATGFRFRRVKMEKATAVSTALGRQAGLVAEWGVGAADPLFAVETEPGDEILATWKECPEAAAMVARRHADGTGHDVFVGPGRLSHELARYFVEKAGCHLYAPARTVNVCAAGNIVVLQATVEGPIDVDVGKKGVVVDFLTGARLGEGPKLSVAFRKGETKILEVK